MTEYAVEEDSSWVLYDGDCALCSGLAARCGPMLRRRGFRLAPLQAPWVRRRLGLASAEQFDEMRLLTSDGKNRGGADAIVELACWFWWAWPLRLAARLPGAMLLLRYAYRYLAARRNCAKGRCGVHARVSGGGRWMDWVLLVCLPLAVSYFRERMAGWVFMWLLAAALWFGCKWLKWRRAARSGTKLSLCLLLGYLLAWPGMLVVYAFTAWKGGHL